VSASDDVTSAPEPDQESLRDRISELLKPRRPVTRKEYRILVATTITLTAVATGFVSLTLYALAVFEALVQMNPAPLNLDRVYIGVVQGALAGFGLMMTIIGVTAGSGVAKRALLEFTSLRGRVSDATAVFAVTVVVIIGGFTFPLMGIVGLAFSIRAVRRFRAQAAEERAVRRAEFEERHIRDDRTAAKTDDRNRSSLVAE
jgi:hypothetical protein